MSSTNTVSQQAAGLSAKSKTSKSAVVLKLLSRTKGATVADLTAATAWQPHTVRAFLSGIRKTANLLREDRASGEAAYRIVAEPAAKSGAEGSTDAAHR